MPKFGYARVSSNDQNLDLQIDELTKASCSKIFSDKISGVNKKRPGLDEAISHLRKKDTFIIWKLDRLGPNLKGLIEFTGQLEKQGIHFKSLTDGIDTTTPAGRFFFHVMASLAQMERELLIERTRAGLDNVGVTLNAANLPIYQNNHALLPFLVVTVKLYA